MLIIANNSRNFFTIHKFSQINDFIVFTFRQNDILTFNQDEMILMNNNDFLNWIKIWNIQHIIIRMIHVIFVRDRIAIITRNYTWNEHICHETKMNVYWIVEF